MTKRLLVPLDESPQAETAVEYALTEFPDAEITLLHVIDPVDGGHAVRTGVPVAGEEWYETAREDAEELFERARALAEEHGATAETATDVGRPARTIVEFADGEFDGIVMGSHGRSGVSRILLGSVAETVVRRSSVPVTVVR